MPPDLEALASEIEDNDPALLEENRAKCEEDGFTLNPAIKRIEVGDYGLRSRNSAGAPGGPDRHRKGNPSRAPAAIRYGNCLDQAQYASPLEL